MTHTPRFAATLVTGLVGAAALAHVRPPSFVRAQMTRPSRPFDFAAVGAPERATTTCFGVTANVVVAAVAVRVSWRGAAGCVRHRRWIESYRSDDNGASWTHVIRAVPDTGRGNPPSLVKLDDGRLVVRFGYRAEPFTIRARISRDQGQSWSDDIILRSGATDWDLGYTRSVQRPDGKIVTVYYYNDATSTELHRGHDLDAVTATAERTSA